MTAAKQGDRVEDRRTPGVFGTVRADSDPITKLARVDWDKGGTSLVFVEVLRLASEVAT